MASAVTEPGAAPVSAGRADDTRSAQTGFRRQRVRLIADYCFGFLNNNTDSV